MCDINHKINRNYLVKYISYTNGNNIWPRIRIYWSWIIKFLIETEYGITAKPRYLVNTTSNKTLERIHQVLVNLVRDSNISETYVDEDDPWSGILVASEFKILSTTNILKGYIPGQLLFGHDMILPIKHKVDWELICQRN